MYRRADATRGSNLEGSRSCFVGAAHAELEPFALNFTVDTVFLKRLYVLFFLELARRRIRRRDQVGWCKPGCLPRPRLPSYLDG